jgi:glucose-6-phosphate 1-dehydrogenase
LDVPIVGVAKSGWSLADLQARAHTSIEAHGGVDRDAFQRLLTRLRYIDGDYSNPETFRALRTALGDARRPSHYLAIPPTLFEEVVQQLAQAGCTSPGT